MLFQASRQLPDSYPNAEPVLLEIIGDTPEETRKVLDYWRKSVDHPGTAADFDVQMERRRLDFNRKASGMIEGEFALTELAGEELMTALDALMPPDTFDDDRTPSQRRQTAFEDLVRGYLEGAETPDVGGERPHVNVMVDLEALQGIPGALHESEEVMSSTWRRSASSLATRRYQGLCGTVDPRSSMLDGAPG